MVNHIDQLGKERERNRTELISKSKNYVRGWGADKNPADRPAYPMEQEPRNGGSGAHWDDPEQQISDVTIYQTLERPHITPVFGTTCAPKLLSGMMRKFAYAKFTENQARHWLILLLADRVDMVEGIFEDLAKGHVPNFWKEMGLSSELKYNRKNFAKKAAIAGGLAVALGALFVISRNRRAQIQE